MMTNSGVGIATFLREHVALLDNRQFFHNKETQLFLFYMNFQ